ncbi:hypothetical protein QR680_000588 [Steinernema hermaphroditum]|uniref:Helicase-associated domain-containing protein n=1 Tax=Steinernema hermaphroditum TaxID=289476 RepID=A0AA39LEB7_9BILA|nr:hypothetical protein QR680_000588 [Steinernema hermaphroditum]
MQARHCKQIDCYEYFFFQENIMSSMFADVDLKELLLGEEKPFIVVEATNCAEAMTTVSEHLLSEVQVSNANREVCCVFLSDVAASMAALKIARDLSTHVGATVSYNTVAGDCRSEDTKLTCYSVRVILSLLATNRNFISDKILLITDIEASDASINLLLSATKMLPARPKKVLVVCAPMTSSKCAAFLNAPVVSFKSNRAHVDAEYLKEPGRDYVLIGVLNTIQYLKDDDADNIMVFMENIDFTRESMKTLKKELKYENMHTSEHQLLYLHDFLPISYQKELLESCAIGPKKVIMATNVGISVDLPNVGVVIDNAFKRTKFGEHLVDKAIYRDEAFKRLHSCGSGRPGKCLRLYTQMSFAFEMNDNQSEESMYRELSWEMLVTTSILPPGIEYIEIKVFEALCSWYSERATTKLQNLNALDASGKITDLGRKMVEFPCDPQMSKMLLASERYNCSEEILTIASLLFAFRDYDWDHWSQFEKFAPEIEAHLALLNIYNEWIQNGCAKEWCVANHMDSNILCFAREVRGNFANILSKVGVPLRSSSDTVNIRKAVLSGYFHNTAVWNGEGYDLLDTEATSAYCPQTLRVSNAIFVPRFAERPKYIMYSHLNLTIGHSLRVVTSIEESWIQEVAPEFFADYEEVQPNK